MTITRVFRLSIPLLIYQVFVNDELADIEYEGPSVQEIELKINPYSEASF